VESGGHRGVLLPFRAAILQTGFETRAGGDRASMDIGSPRRQYEIEPIEDPVPREDPKPRAPEPVAPERESTPPELVPN
jgi:hypothetical protein